MKAIPIAEVRIATEPSLDAGRAWPAARYAWFVVAMLMTAYALAILDRVSIALLIQPLQASLKISDTQFGLLQGMAFSLVYSLLGLPFGILCDRWIRVRILVGGLVVWSLATVAGGFAHSFTELFAARMLVGVGEAALVPVASSLIADYFAPDVRPRAYGAFVAGSSIGSVIAMICSGIFLVWSERLITHVPTIFGGMASWQLVLIMCGTPGLILALVILITVREPARKGVSTNVTSFNFRSIYVLLRSHPFAYGGLIGGTVLNLVSTYAVVGWFPAMFIRMHGWSAAHAGWLLGAVGAPISLFTAFNSGWVISWLTKRGNLDAPMIAASGTALSFAIFGPMACLSHSATVAMIGYVMFSFFLNWNMPSVYSGITQITPNELRGQMMAIHMISSGLIALTGGNYLVGFLSDKVFPTPHGIGSALSVIFVICGLSSALLLLSTRSAFRRAARSAVPPTEEKTAAA